MHLRPLRARTLPIETCALARALIGSILVSESAAGRSAGRIVETEAYPPDDPACHARVGKTERNATLFGPPLRAYVYLAYGSAFCFNLASEPSGVGAGVLVRALEPLDGVALMRARRGGARERDLCRGPGRLCRALAIDRRDDGVALFSAGRLWLAQPDRPVGALAASARIGIARAAKRRLRFFDASSAYVSGSATLNHHPRCVILRPSRSSTG